MKNALKQLEMDGLIVDDDAVEIEYDGAQHSDRLTEIHLPFQLKML
jgi:hypothetical protein